MNSFITSPQRSKPLPTQRTIAIVPIPKEFGGRWSPLHGPGDSDGELVLREQHIDQAEPAGGADGPQGVGAALQLCDAQVVRQVALQPLQGVLTERPTHSGQDGSQRTASRWHTVPNNREREKSADCTLTSTFNLVEPFRIMRENEQFTAFASTGFQLFKASE